ncbi:hypothetical protein HBB04_00468 [Pseudomonas coronafaciens]|nr:hypothetical protein HBB04_00468 [Pseudomonas coronafaciens]
MGADQLSVDLTERQFSGLAGAKAPDGLQDRKVSPKQRVTHRISI